MKKIKLIALLLIVVLTVAFLASCGNENFGWGNFTYGHAYIGIGSDGHCVNVSSWHDNDLGVELHLQNGTSIYCSEGTYILFKDSTHCPFC